jgi:pimeloyl-ACP methyl ester carboxylesterase
MIEAGAAEMSEAAVFVHGNPGSHEDWLDLVGLVGGFGRAVAFDMPGFGRCRVPRGFACDVPAYAAFIGAALEALGVARAHLVVHDFGGPWGFAWAADHSDCLASLVAMNTAMLTGRTWHAAARRFRQPIVGELTQLLVNRRRFREALTAGGAMPLPREFIDRMWRDYDAETRRTVLRLYRATDLPYEDAGRWVKTLRARDLPALFVWGMRDRFAPPKAMDYLREAFPSAEVVELPDSGHFPFADDPDAVADAVIPFLRRGLG